MITSFPATRTIAPCSDSIVVSVLNVFVFSRRSSSVRIAWFNVIGHSETSVLRVFLFADNDAVHDEVADFSRAVLGQFVNTKPRIHTVLSYLERIDSPHAFSSKCGLVAMLLHIPRKHPHALKVDIRVGRRLAFTNDVPRDLTRQRVLYPVDHLNGPVDEV